MRSRLSCALLLAVAAVLLALAWRPVRNWIAAHPEHNPWAPLTLDQREGWATQMKIEQLRSDPRECRAVLARSGIELQELPAIGEGTCRRSDRALIPDLSLQPGRAEATCAVSAALLRWMRREVQPAARRHLGSEVVKLEHYGTYSCRRMYGDPTARWSEHATGNAIDVAAFVLADGRRIGVLNDWRAGGDRAAFLHAVRDGACGPFGTVLSPDYNAAHADHLHLDQGRWMICR